MQSHLIYYATLLLFLIKTSESACPVKPNTAIVTALLPLHSGNDCSDIELRGLQQAAALQATVNTLNQDVKKESNILISLKIQDTCSSEDGAVKAALKSMVDSDQTCLHPPLFMGFIGPEGKAVLDAVHHVTKLFNATHVIPFGLETLDDTILHVANQQSQSHSHSIITVLHQLEWKTFSLATDDSLTNQELAKDILELLQVDQTLCLVNNVAHISDSASINTALRGSTGYGIVVLADSAEVAIEILQANKLIATPMVIFINKIGLQNWQIPSYNSTLVILQQTTMEPIDGLAEAINASLYSNYLRQQDQLFKETNCKDSKDVTTCLQNMEKDVFQGSLDSTLLPMSYATRLMASSLLIAHKSKCRMAGVDVPVPGLCSKLSHMPQGEWRNLLQRSTTLVKQTQIGNLPTRIHFQMELSNALDIYLRNQITLDLEKIGQIVSGDKLKLGVGYSFPTSIDVTKIKTKICPSNGNLPALPTIWTQSAKAPPAVVLEPVEGHGEDEFYDMVTLLCGAGLGILIFFVLMIYIVYSSFKVKTEKQSSAGSPTFERKPSRIARWRRGSGQSSRASIRTID